MCCPEAAELREVRSSECGAGRAAWSDVVADADELAASRPSPPLPPLPPLEPTPPLLVMERDEGLPPESQRHEASASVPCLSPLEAAARGKKKKRAQKERKKNERARGRGLKLPLEDFDFFLSSFFFLS